MTIQKKLIRGSVFALMAFFSMAVFGILTKLAYLEAGAIWVSFITYLVGTLILLPFIAFHGMVSLKSNHYTYLISRGIIGCAASFLYMLSMKYIPIVNATLLFNTAPIFIPLIAMIWLKAKVSRNTWLAIVLGFIGIVVIVRPTEEIFTQPGNLVALASGISLAMAYLLIKQLTVTDTNFRIVFYYLFVSTIVQIPLLFFAGPLPSIESCFWATLSGIALLLAQVALVRAYTYASASQVGVYQYSSVVFVGIINWLIWGDIPSKLDLLGVILVIIAGAIIIRAGFTNNIQLNQESDRA